MSEKFRERSLRILGKRDLDLRQVSIPVAVDLDLRRGILAEGTVEGRLQRLLGRRLAATQDATQIPVDKAAGVHLIQEIHGLGEVGVRRGAGAGAVLPPFVALQAGIVAHGGHQAVQAQHDLAVQRNRREAVGLGMDAPAEAVAGPAGAPIGPEAVQGEVRVGITLFGQILTFRFLRMAEAEARLPTDREHVRVVAFRHAAAVAATARLAIVLAVRSGTGGNS